jgi:hypothetical protein
MGEPFYLDFNEKCDRGSRIIITKIWSERSKLDSFRFIIGIAICFFGNKPYQTEIIGLGYEIGYEINLKYLCFEELFTNFDYELHAYRT